MSKLFFDGPFMRTAVFSIISPNRRHYARVLMASVQRNHPAWDRFVVLVGETSASDRDEESFTTVPLEALPLPSPRRFCFRYTILELNTAVKPWMFEHLFARGYGRVVYLDPDIFVYSPLIEIDAAPSETFLMLTPHLTGSIGGDDHPSERAILQCGAYNLGFLAVSRRPTLARFLAWWQEKLEFQCVVEIERGLFVDQKWMDLAPGLFPDVAILRHEGYNVAYWNLRQRSVVGAGGRIAVNGQPLRFFHFSGVDPADPDMVSRHDGRLRIGDVGDARKLIEDYGVALRAAGREAFENAPYAFGVFADGARVPDVARVAYRNSTDLQLACGDDPFAHPELFRGLRDRPRGPLAARIGVKSYRMFSRPRPLVRLIPRPFRTAMREFLLGRKEPAPRTFRAKALLPRGLNVVGFHARDTGVGESARLCRKACEREGLSSHVIDVECADGLAQQAVYRTSVYHVNADQTPRRSQSDPRPLRLELVQHRLLALGAAGTAGRVDLVGRAAGRDLGAQRLHSERHQPEGDDPGRPHASRNRGHRHRAVLAPGARRAAGAIHISLHVRPRQRHAAQEPLRCR